MQQMYMWRSNLQTTCDNHSLKLVLHQLYNSAAWPVLVVHAVQGFSPKTGLLHPEMLKWCLIVVFFHTSNQQECLSVFEVTLHCFMAAQDSSSFAYFTQRNTRQVRHAKWYCSTWNHQLNTFQMYYKSESDYHQYGDTVLPCSTSSPCCDIATTQNRLYIIKQQRLPAHYHRKFDSTVTTDKICSKAILVLQIEPHKHSHCNIITPPRRGTLSKTIKIAAISYALTSQSRKTQL